MFFFSTNIRNIEYSYKLFLMNYANICKIMLLRIFGYSSNNYKAQPLGIIVQEMHQLWTNGI